MAKGNQLDLEREEKMGLRREGGGGEGWWAAWRGGQDGKGSVIGVQVGENERRD